MHDCDVHNDYPSRLSGDAALARAAGSVPLHGAEPTDGYKSNLRTSSRGIPEQKRAHEMARLAMYITKKGGPRMTRPIALGVCFADQVIDNSHTALTRRACKQARMAARIVS